MENWEYMIIAVTNQDGWKASSVNGTEIPTWKKGPHVSTYLNQRGSEGWELVSWTLVKSTGTFGYGQEAERFHAVLKRRKS